MASLSKRSGFTLSKMMKKLHSLPWFDPEDPILDMHYQPPRGKTKLLICTGSNATGKTFFGRLIAAYCKSPKGLDGKAECLRVGMEIRTTEGMHRAFVLQGPEHEESTGVNSTHMLVGVLRNAKNREHDNVVVIDEPDIGLSESYSIAMGKFIAKELETLSPRTKLVAIVSHSRHLLEPLLDFNPAFVRFGDDLTLEEWMEEGPPPKTIQDLLNLPNQSRDIWRKINKELRN